jgi:hypothetical protein
VFYSPDDNGYFIAIGNRNIRLHCHEIFTVIPANNKGKWMLNHSKLSTAKALACKARGFSPVDFENACDHQRSIQPPSSIKVSCMYRTDKYLLTKKLFNSPKNEFTGELGEFINSLEFMKQCIEVASEKGIEKQDMVSILVRTTLSEQPVVLDLLT